VTGIEHRCWWLREALAQPEFAVEPAPPLARDERADVVIVGGGYTGLWTAWHLKRLDPGVDVVVLEGDRCGFGPSGRNGGFLNGFYDHIVSLVESFGPTGARAMLDAGDAAVAGVSGWLAERGVDAWYRADDAIAVASSPRQVAAWEPYLSAARELGVDDRYRLLDAEQLAGYCTSPVFEGGLYVVDGGTLQPARLALALRRACLDAGVRVFERTPVEPIGPRDPSHQGGGPAPVRAAGGVVRAESVVVGANAWVASWPAFRRKVVARATFMAITAPAPDRLADINWTSGTGIYDLRLALRYLRPTPDGRIALGVGGERGSWTGRIDQRFDSDATGIRHAVEAIHQFFPSFRDVPIDAGWGGPIDVSPTHQPFVGQLPGGVHYALGYTGNGVGPTHLIGEVLATRVLGRESAMTGLPIVDGEPRPWPRQPFRGLGASLVNAATVRCDDLLDRGRRPDPITAGLARLPRLFGYRVG